MDSWLHHFSHHSGSGWLIDGRKGHLRLSHGAPSAGWRTALCLLSQRAARSLILCGPIPGPGLKASVGGAVISPPYALLAGEEPFHQEIRGRLHGTEVKAASRPL